MSSTKTGFPGHNRRFAPKQEPTPRRCAVCGKTIGLGSPSITRTLKGFSVEHPGIETVCGACADVDN